MIQHIVLFRLHEGVAWGDPRVLRAEATTQAHPDHIEEIRTWLAGRNVTTRDMAYDFALVGSFEDRSALDRYMVHPHHLLGKRYWREIATWVVADLELAEMQSSRAVVVVPNTTPHARTEI
jgi:hypothetical protein